MQSAHDGLRGQQNVAASQLSVLDDTVAGHLHKQDMLPQETANNEKLAVAGRMQQHAVDIKCCQCT